MEQADQLLVDMYENGKAKYLDKFDDEREVLNTPNCAFLCRDAATHARKERHSPSQPFRHATVAPKSDQEFKDRLMRFAGPLMEGLLPMKNVVIAGGAVLRTIFGEAEPLTDQEDHAGVDLFVVADDETEARQAFNGILAHLRDTRRVDGGGIDHRELVVARTPFAITFAVGPPQRNMQLILRRHRCIADVIFKLYVTRSQKWLRQRQRQQEVYFCGCKYSLRTHTPLLYSDIDCCQVAWDGERVLATPAASRALRTGINWADPERRNFQYEDRLYKYARTGFLVGVPGLDLRLVKEQYLRNCVYGKNEEGFVPVELKFQKGENFPS